MPSTAASELLTSTNVMKKSNYLTLLVIAIIIAGIIAIGIGVLCFYFGNNNEDFQPTICYIFGAGIAYFLYSHLSKEYDNKLAITTGVSTFVVLTGTFALLQNFSDFASLIVETIAWILVALTIESYIIYKIFEISKEEYDKLD